MDPETEAAAAGAAVEAAVENVAENAEAAIDAANARAEAAERTAEEIAAAAMESARGQEIEHLRSENETWRTQEEAARRSFETETQNRLQSLSEQMASLSLALSPPAPSTPTASEEATEIPVTQEAAEILEQVTDPVSPEPVESEGAPPVVVAVVPRKRRQWM